MKTTLAIAATFVVAILANAQFHLKESDFYRTGGPVVPKEKGGPFVSYSSRESLREDYTRVAKTNPFFAEAAERQKANLPAGGAISVMLREKIEAAANTKNISVQILDRAGKELLRSTGIDQDPIRDGDPNLPWSADIRVMIPQEWSGFLTVKVWNALTRKMWIYTVTAPVSEGSGNSE